MRWIWLDSLIRHLFLTPNRQYSRLIRWVCNTWCLSHRLDDIWIKSPLQTTPTILHNEFYLPSYDTLYFCAKVSKLGCGNLDKLGGAIWLQGANQLVLWVFYKIKTISATFYLGCDHFRNTISTLVFISKSNQFTSPGAKWLSLAPKINK